MNKCNNNSSLFSPNQATKSTMNKEVKEFQIVQSKERRFSSIVTFQDPGIINDCESQNSLFKDVNIKHQKTQKQNPPQSETLLNEAKSLQSMLTKSMVLNKNNFALMTILPMNMVPVDNEKDYGVPLSRITDSYKRLK